VQGQETRTAPINEEDVGVVLPVGRDSDRPESESRRGTIRGRAGRIGAVDEAGGEDFPWSVRADLRRLMKPPGELAPRQ